MRVAFKVLIKYTELGGIGTWSHEVFSRAVTKIHSIVVVSLLCFYVGYSRLPISHHKMAA